MSAANDGLYLMYGDDWNERFTFMIDAVDEAAARAAYESKQPIAIAAGEEPISAGREHRNEDGQPAIWLIHADVGAAEGAFFNVTFFNFWGTNEGEYVFREQDNGKLLLTQVDVFHYDTHTRRLDLSDWSSAEQTKFRADGYSNRAILTQLADGSKNVEFTEYTDTDITANWEEIPAFGDWAGLTRDDRFT